MQKSVKPEAEERQRHPPSVNWSLFWLEWATYPLAGLVVAGISFQYKLLLSMCVRSAQAD